MSPESENSGDNLDYEDKTLAEIQAERQGRKVVTNVDVKDDDSGRLSAQDRLALFVATPVTIVVVGVYMLASGSSLLTALGGLALAVSVLFAYVFGQALWNDWRATK